MERNKIKTTGKKYVARREVLKVLGIHWQTLNNMQKKGLIEYVKTEGGHRRYDLDGYLKNNKKQEKKRVCYCRVSSKKQKEDLKRQIAYMKKHYPEYEIYYDIGSGLNFKRPNFVRIMEEAIDGKIQELVIAYKDRLARIGYEIVDWMISKYSDGTITIINKSEEETPEEEMTKDILTIMNVYVAKMNGRRKYK